MNLYMIKSNSILNFVLILSLITGVFLRLYNINHDNLWIDEMATFWVTDPSISFKEINLSKKHIFGKSSDASSERLIIH